MLFGYDKYTFTDGWVNICEGPLDCIWLHQNGYQNTVATLGASLSIMQFSLLQKMATGIRVCYDNDIAGRNGRAKIYQQYKKYIAIDSARIPLEFNDMQEITNFEGVLDSSMKKLVAQ